MTGLRYSQSARFDRRQFCARGALGLACLALGRSTNRAGEKERTTRFQIACMTLPYAQFPLERALAGIQGAGYEYVAWGTTHREADGKRVPVMLEDAAPAKARDLGKRCRDLGLEPLLMFSGIYPDARNHLEVFKNRIAQAAAAGIPQLLTFGHTQKGNYPKWIEQFKLLGPIARDQGVLIVIKPHGGLTATGSLAAKIIHDVADEGVKVNFDSGNVMDDPKVDAAAALADLRECAKDVRSFCIKDKRHFPKNEDCGPGFGEVDHYKLLSAVAFTGRSMPLCCENIFAPLLPRPTNAEGIDALARRAREFLEVVVRGLQAM